MCDPKTNKVILTRDVKWAEWQPTDPEATLDLFARDLALKNRKKAGIGEASDCNEEEDPKPRPHVIPVDDEEEGARANGAEAGRTQDAAHDHNTQRSGTTRVRLPEVVRDPNLLTREMH